MSIRRAASAFLFLFWILLLTSCGDSRSGPEPAPPSKETPVQEEPAEPAPSGNPETAPDPQKLLPEPADGDFVRAADYIPGLTVQLHYATADNFTGQVIYGFSDAYLRYGTVKKLAAVQTALAEEGLGLKIWDAFRPPEAQFRLWEICPDSRYVANPNKGFSSHSRGNTVDVTLVDADGNELDMPTGFDDFSARADRDYSDVSPEAADHARLLEAAMTAEGFQPYFGEWWHFSDVDSYPVEEAFLPPAEDMPEPA